MCNSFVKLLSLVSLAWASQPCPLLAQNTDTTTWQATGRRAFTEWAQVDSAVAQSLFRYLKLNDLRFLNVADYGDGAIEMWQPDEEPLVVKYGVRFYADSDLIDDRVRQQRYYEPYHFAATYNAALKSFVLAPDSSRNCFLAQAGPFGSCPWTPFRPHAAPPLERPEVLADSATQIAMLDAALLIALHFTSGTVPIALDAELGWDGIYQPARTGRHPAAWLDSSLGRGLVTCIKNAPSLKACPAQGPLVTISINVPRIDYQGALVIHIRVDAQSTQDPKAECGFGCYSGAEFDALLEKADGGWTAKPGPIMWSN
jgi:hypothetical protein